MDSLEEKNDGLNNHEQEKPSAADFRNAAYVVLFIAAVFVVNAMETGSYRTPWPVAIIVSLVGIGLYAYSFIKNKQENS